jgi:hypothetical protein
MTTLGKMLLEKTSSREKIGDKRAKRKYLL